jgi:hypothetical protein
MHILPGGRARKKDMFEEFWCAVTSLRIGMAQNAKFGKAAWHTREIDPITVFVTFC